MVVALDCIDIDFPITSKLAKTVKKLSREEGRFLLFVLTDCDIMCESETEIKD